MSDTIFSSGGTAGIITENIPLPLHDGMPIVPGDDQTITVTSPDGTLQTGDVLLANTMPEAEYMYGCTPTAVGMLLGYYDLYGYRGEDFSALIEGDVDLKSRGTDGNAYDMDAFDTVLGRAIASKEYVYRFYSRGDLDVITGNKAGTYWTTSAEEELEYSFVNGGEGPEIRTDIWNCIADYLGTGQIWRGNDNLSTSISQATLEQILNYEMNINYIAGDLQRLVDYRYTSMLYGLNLYVESKGYSLDRKITGTYIVDTAGGDFTFEDYKAEIDAGRPVLISLEGHSMVGYGYNPDTNEIIFDDCYRADQRMVWGETYLYSDMYLPLQSITVIGLMGGGGVDLAVEPIMDGSTERFFSANSVPFSSGDYCYPGDQVSLNFTVSNLGTITSGAFEVTVYVDGKLAKTISVLLLEENATTEYTGIQLDALAPGLHTVRVVADEANVIQETSGANNVLEQKLMVLKNGANIVTGIKAVDAGQVSQDDYVASGWQMHVLSGGTASGTVVRGIVTDVSPNGMISYLPGLAVVSQGGLVQDAEVYEYAQIQLAGTAEDLHVFENGTAVVSTGGKLTGKLTVENGGGVSMEEGTTLDFNLTKMSAGAAALVNDLSRIQGTPLYTLTVGGTEADGTYALADGAAGFADTLYVVNPSGVFLGTLTVGETTKINSSDYTLKLNSGTLALFLNVYPDETPGPETQDDAGVVSGRKNSTITFQSDVYLQKGASIYAAYPGALQLTANGLTVTLAGDNELSCTSIRNADILFGHDAYWTSESFGPHYDGTVNINGENISFYSAVSNCITAAGIVGNNLTVSFNGDASGSKSISFESTNPSSGPGNYAAAIIADGNLVINGTFGGNVNSHFDFSAVPVDDRRYAYLYGFSAEGNLTVNGDVSGNIFLSAVSTAGSYAFGLNAEGNLSVSGEISGIIAATAEDSVYAISGSQVNVTVSGTVFAGKSSAENDMATLLNKLNSWDAYKDELLGLVDTSCYAVYASDASRINFRGDALIVGNFGLFYTSGCVITVSDAACIYGDFFTYYSENKVVLKLNDASLEGTRIVSSSWSSPMAVTVDADEITSNGTYSLVETADSSSLNSVILSVAGQENTLTAGQAVKIGDVEYALSRETSGSGEKMILAVSGLKENSGNSDPIGNPVGTSDKVSWEATETAQYIVEYSTDNFEHVIRVITTGNAVDTPDLPAGTYQWRVKTDGGEWTVGEAIAVAPGAISSAPKVVQSNEDGSEDLFFASPVGAWENIYYAQHVGSVNDWTGTNEFVSAAGKGRIQNLFFGSADPNVLCLTDAENGDAIFVDDVYTDLPESMTEHTSRLYKIQEVRAGAGDDIVDMTSRRFEYTGSGLTIRGGDGDDVIWANKSDNVLFGDAGNDRIVGASGSDVIAGGIGDDSMHGGGSDDVFTFCDNWGADTVQQLENGSVTLWFASGSLTNWNAETLTYTDGDNSVTVSGVAAEKITLKFGENSPEDAARFASLSDIGAFDAFTSRKIFEEADKGILAGV